MRLTVTTWNINSVRLRIESVLRFLKAVQPDVLCLQETKCPDEPVPLKAFEGSGYENIVFAGQKGYNGVAILSRFPLLTRDVMSFCGKPDARHICAALGPEAGPAAGSCCTISTCPPGRRPPSRPEPEISRTSSTFLQELRAWGGRRVSAPRSWSATSTSRRWSTTCGRTSSSSTCEPHPLETEALETLRGEAVWIDGRPPSITPEPEKIYTWWSYRSPDWAAPTRAGASTMPGSPPTSRHGAPSRGVREARGWDKPSDHAPVTLTLAL